MYSYSFLHIFKHTLRLPVSIKDKGGIYLYIYIYISFIYIDRQYFHKVKVHLYNKPEYCQRTNI